MSDIDKVSIDKLDVDNYATWSQRMKWLLIQKGQWGPVTQEVVTDEAADQKALALIGLSVKDHHLSTLAGCNTAKQAWEALEAVYKAKSNARKLQLKRELNSLKKDSAEPLTKYVARAKSIRDQLTAAGNAIKEEEVAWSVLAGLPREYDILVTVLETSEEALELDGLLAKLLTVEQRTSPKSEKEDQAYFSRDNQHKGRPSASRLQPRREERECFYCGKKGHLRKDCHKRLRDEKAAGHGLQQQQRQQAPVLVSKEVALAAQGLRCEQEWVLDSGASRHITNDSSKMFNMRRLDMEVAITFGNGAQSKASVIGDIIMTDIQGSNVERIILRDVLYIPEAWANLLSIPHSVKNGVKFEFGNSICSILKDGILIAKAMHQNGLYCIRSYATEKALQAKESPELWHRRFGHLGYDNLARLQQQNMVKGIGVETSAFKSAGNKVCETCIKAKQHRLPFQASQSDSVKPLELLHMDVCGPLPEPSLGGSKYLATFLDDFSKLSVVRPISSKSDVPTVTKEVVEMLENQSSERLRVVRTDNVLIYVVLLLFAVSQVPCIYVLCVSSYSCV